MVPVKVAVAGLLHVKVTCSLAATGTTFVTTAGAAASAKSIVKGLIKLTKTSASINPLKRVWNFFIF